MKLQEGASRALCGLPQEMLYVPVGHSFTRGFADAQPRMLECCNRIRSTTTRPEAVRHPRRPCAATMAERHPREARVGSIRAPLLLILTGALDFLLAPAIV